jgi:ferritin-like metal-binding protein YciE
MRLFSSSPTFDSFDSLFLDQLQDLYDAEERLVKALPKMADAAHNRELKTAFRDHLSETKNQVRRLEKVFKMLGESTKGKTCAAMKGLIQEGEEMIDAKGDPNIRDAALIAAANRVEHYEIAAYGTARTFAQYLGRQDAADLFQESLDEERAADKKLTELAEGFINVKAQLASV